MSKLWSLATLAALLGALEPTLLRRCHTASYGAAGERVAVTKASHAIFSLGTMACAAIWLEAGCLGIHVAEAAAADASQRTTRRKRRKKKQFKSSNANPASAVNTEAPTGVAGPSFGASFGRDFAAAAGMQFGVAAPLARAPAAEAVHWSGVPDYVYVAAGAGLRGVNGVYTPVAVVGGALAYVNKHNVVLHRTQLGDRPGFVLVRKFFSPNDEVELLYGAPTESLTPPVDTPLVGGWVEGTEEQLPTLSRLEGAAANDAFRRETMLQARRRFAKLRQSQYERLPKAAQSSDEHRWSREPPPAGHSVADLLASLETETPVAGSDGASDSDDRIRDAAVQTDAAVDFSGSDVRAADTEVDIVAALAGFTDLQLKAELARRRLHGDSVTRAALGTTTTESVLPSAPTRADSTDTEAGDRGGAVALRDRRLPHAPVLVHTLAMLANEDLPPLLAGSSLDLRTITELRRSGHTVTPALFDEDELSPFRPHIHATVAEAGLREASSLHKDFARLHGLWRQSEAVRRLVLSPRLAKAASELLGAPRVRLYQDSVFLKEVGDHTSQWHNDAVAMPINTDLVVTAWIPIVDIAPGMGVLRFASRSHLDSAVGVNLDFAEIETKYNITSPVSAHYDSDGSPVCMLTGDVSWHLGRTLHGAEPNLGAWTREALTATFFADGARTYSSEHDLLSVSPDDAATLAHWPDLPGGAELSGEFVPIAGGQE